MRPVQRIIIAVNGECGWFPTGVGMATGTIRRNSECDVIRIRTLIVVRCVATCTIGRGTCIPRSMAVEAVGCQVRPCQREIGVVMVKSAVRFSRRVAGKAGRAVV